MEGDVIETIGVGLCWGLLDEKGLPVPLMLIGVVMPLLAVEERRFDEDETMEEDA